jgi:hypothetical protein
MRSLLDVHVDVDGCYAIQCVPVDTLLGFTTDVTYS